MAHVQFKYDGSGKSSALGATVSEDHFGSAFENRGQTLTSDSTFVAVASRLGLPCLRFPGGTQTENYFDPSNPDDARPTAIFANVGSEAEFVPISDFLSFAAANNVAPVIVLPTWRYFNTETRQVDPSAEAVIKQFVSDVVHGVYGDVAIRAFEVGNEWFNDAFSWTPAEFGRLQKTIAVWVDEALTDQGSERPDIWIQSNQEGRQDHDGNGVNDNTEFLNAFDASELGIVDGVVDHFYQPVRAQSALDDAFFDEAWIPATRVARLAQDGWDVVGPSAIDIVATEWNIRADRGESGPLITGLERSAMFLRLFAEMLQAGVDIANVFTVQALGQSNGTLSRKDADTLTPTGLQFEMMKRALVGTQLMDPSGDGRLSRSDFVFHDVSGADVGYTYTFSGDNKVVVYLSSAVGRSTAVNANFEQLLKHGYHVHGSKIVPIGGNPLEEDADAQVIELPYSHLDGAKQGDGVLSFTLGAYETIQLEFTIGVGVDIAIAKETRASNTLEGSEWNDRLQGGRAADTIIGGNGNDTLIGEAGADLLIGEAGDDVYVVDPADIVLELRDGGDDLITSAWSRRLDANVERLKLTGSGNIGGWGNQLNNVLEGNGGNNYLDGGAGNDTLIAGAGRDSLVGGVGVDTVWLTGRQGTRIDLAAGSLLRAKSISFIAGVENIRGSEGNDTLLGDAGSNLLIGSGGADVMSGRGGNDTYIVDSLDVIYELPGQGVDTVITTGSYKLAPNFENLILVGQSGGFLFGNALDNRVVGNAGNNVLDGRFGFDTLIGGLGDDMYLVRDLGDILVELPGQGIDTVVSWNSWQLEANFERLRLVGDKAINGTGNAGNNLMFGNSSDNVLSGGAGNDTIIGGLGNDHIIGGAGEDWVLYGGFGSSHVDLAKGKSFGTFGVDTLSGIENVRAGFGNDTLIGNSGNNRLAAGGGDDVIHGGAGDDFIFAGAGSDVIDGGAGSDWVYCGEKDRSADTVVLSSVQHSKASLARDRVFHFEHGIDKIDLSKIDASTEASGTQEFNWSSRSAANSVWVQAQRPGAYLVSGDVNGDGLADFQISVQADGLLANGDFIF